MANPFPFVAGEVLTAADMNGIGEWTAYTPVLSAGGTPVTLGAGSTQSGTYARIQDLIIYRFRVAFGTSGQNFGSGNYTISLPVTASGVTQFYESSIGTTAIYDQSAGNVYYANAWISSTTSLSLISQAAFNGGLNNVTQIFPFTAAASDSYSGLVVYRAA
jgi:hypothetical protein